jgi:hypothetical protein
MTLLDRQRQGVRLGAIRIGIKVVKDGKTRPQKLNTFRLTSPDRVKVEAAAQVYGGEVQAWKPNDNAGQQWEVVTTVDRMDVRIPPGDPVAQDYELWTTTRQRLCDGVTERMKGRACQCPRDLMERKEAAKSGDACKPITRLNLILADLPGLGVWQLSSTGDAAADELASTAEFLQRAGAGGVMLPAVLRLEQRESRGSGELRRFAVPVLDVAASMLQLETGQFTPAGLIGNGGPNPGQRALPAGSAPDPTVPKQIDAQAAPVEERTVAPLPLPDDLTPQKLANLARTATHKDQVRDLKLHARTVGWLEEFVDDAQGVSEPLDNALFTEFERLGGTA